MAAILLAGVAISFFCSSFILFIQYVSGFTQLFQITRWLMGELAVTGFAGVRELAPLVLCGSGIIFFMSKELNLLATGEEMAISRGLNLGLVRNILFFTTSLMIGGIVARCGPIGFVGMMAPHICRLLVGADHRRLIPMTFLFGGCFLTLCDTLGPRPNRPGRDPGRRYHGPAGRTVLRLVARQRRPGAHRPLSFESNLTQRPFGNHTPPVDVTCRLAFPLSSSSASVSAS